MPDLIQIARGTAAEWATADPVLKVGEPGFETDTKVLRIGDGAKKFTDLAAMRSVTNLSVTRDGTKVTVVSDTGTDGAIPAASASDAGVMSAADKTKLDGIEAGASGDLTGAEIKTLYEGEADTNAYTDAEKTKLAGIEAGAEVNHVVAVNTQTGTAYTLALTDADDIVEMNNVGANTLTVPANATVAFPIGTIISVTQLGAGATTITAAAGVSLNGVAAGSAAISAQYDGVTLYKRAADAWVIQGAHGGVA